jgi:hypothetical protein
MRAATGRRGSSSPPVAALTNKNGVERAKARRKNFRGDLPREAIIFAES